MIRQQCALPPAREKFSTELSPPRAKNSPRETKVAHCSRPAACTHHRMSDWINHNQRRRDAVNMAVYAMTPLTATEFDALVDHVGPLNRWPINMAEAIVSTHLTYQPRFQLTLFLLGNRVPPTVFTAWFLSRNMLRDVSARRHVAGILLAHKTGKLEADGKTAWIVNAVDREGNDVLDKNQVVVTPRFAHEEPQYWDEAVKKLNTGCAYAVLPPEDWQLLSADVILPYRQDASRHDGPVFQGLHILTEVAAVATPHASPLRPA